MKLTATVERLLAETEEIGDLLGQLRQRLATVYLLLDKAMHDAHPPLCPKCQAPMVIRSQKNNPEARFLGCTRYRNGCKGSMDIDKWRIAAEEALRAQEAP